MNAHYTSKVKRGEAGFSLVEMSIVLVIIGLIIAAVTVGKRTMENAEYYRAYQKVVVPCIAAATASMARNNGVIGTLATTDVATINLPDETAALTCAGATNVVTIDNASAELRDLTNSNLAGNASYTLSDFPSTAATKKFTITITTPGSAT